jgi:hypothetical protein
MSITVDNPRGLNISPLMPSSIIGSATHQITTNGASLDKWSSSTQNFNPANYTHVKYENMIMRIINVNYDSIYVAFVTSDGRNIQFDPKPCPGKFTLEFGLYIGDLSPGASPGVSPGVSPGASPGYESLRINSYISAAKYASDASKYAADAATSADKSDSLISTVEQYESMTKSFLQKTVDDSTRMKNWTDCMLKTPPNAGLDGFTPVTFLNVDNSRGLGVPKLPPTDPDVSKGATHTLTNGLNIDKWSSSRPDFGFGNVGQYSHVKFGNLIARIVRATFFNIKIVFVDREGNPTQLSFDPIICPDLGGNIVLAFGSYSPQTIVQFNKTSNDVQESARWYTNDANSKVKVAQDSVQTTQTQADTARGIRDTIRDLSNTALSQANSAQSAADNARTSSTYTQASQYEQVAKGAAQIAMDSADRAKSLVLNIQIVPLTTRTYSSPLPAPEKIQLFKWCETPRVTINGADIYTSSTLVDAVARCANDDGCAAVVYDPSIEKYTLKRFDPSGSYIGNNGVNTTTYFKFSGDRTCNDLLKEFSTIGPVSGLNVQIASDIQSTEREIVPPVSKKITALNQPFIAKYVVFSSVSDTTLSLVLKVGIDTIETATYTTTNSGGTWSLSSTSPNTQKILGNTITINEGGKSFNSSTKTFFVVASMDTASVMGSGSNWGTVKNVNIPGNDIVKRNGDTLQSCKDVCTGVANCKAIVFEENFCILKSDASRQVPTIGKTTYIKNSSLKNSYVSTGGSTLGSILPALNQMFVSEYLTFTYSDNSTMNMTLTTINATENSTYKLDTASGWILSRVSGGTTQSIIGSSIKVGSDGKSFTSSIQPPETFSVISFAASSSPLPWTSSVDGAKIDGSYIGAAVSVNSIGDFKTNCTDPCDKNPNCKAVVMDNVNKKCTLKSSAQWYPTGDTNTVYLKDAVYNNKGTWTVLKK